MQISLKWIEELVKIESIKLNDLIDKLTLGGFEVEEILELEINDQTEIILDISTTANRSDSLSIQGISTEIAALLDQPLKISNYSLKTHNWKKIIENLAENSSNNHSCSMFLAVIVENLTNTSVPKWIKQKLISSGIVPSNNLLDFQNYILLETGYPFTFYDFNKICLALNNSKFNLSISNAKNKQTFQSTDNIEYRLDNSILTVNANKVPISIAGITEAEDFFYSESTNKFLIEGSIFNAAKIRQQSRTLGLRTDRSARYEKSLKNTYLIESFYRLICLLRIFNPYLVCKLHTINKISEEIPKPILLRYETINEILGPTNKSKQGHFNYLNPENITNYLRRLNFKFKYDEVKFFWEVEIPHSRTEDLTREIDLIEEIGRLHGFNNFLTSLPKIKTIGTEDFNYKTRKKITSCLLNLGFNELIHYSLVKEKTFLTNKIQLINPLLSDYSSLRLSLLPNLINTVKENLKQGNSSLEGFEYGHVFSEDSITNFKENEHVAGVFGGIQKKLSWSDSSKLLTWFEAKGKIEQLLNQLNLVTDWKSYSSRDIGNILHPYRSAELYLPNESRLGIFGQINPILATQLNLSSKIYLFEFNIEMIESQLRMNKLTLYKEYPLYPKIIKDLSFIVKNTVTFNRIQETLYLNGTEFLSEINLLDEYRGHSIPKDHLSLCLQLIFQSPKKTLENKDIESIIQKLQLILAEKFDASIRQ